MNKPTQSPSTELCIHWRPARPDGSGRVLNAEYTGLYPCVYCEVDRLQRHISDMEGGGVVKVPISVMFERINEIAEDMRLSGVTTSAEDQELQVVFDRIAARHGVPVTSHEAATDYRPKPGDAIYEIETDEPCHIEWIYGDYAYVIWESGYYGTYKVSDMGLLFGPRALQPTAASTPPP